MPAIASHRLRVVTREIPGAWLAAAALVALALLLVAGGAPLRPALATFALGVVVAVAFVWLLGVAGRRRAEAAHAAVVAEGLERLRAQLATPAEAESLAAELALLTAPRGRGRRADEALGAEARAAVAAVRAVADARSVHVGVVVERDALGGAALRAALRRLVCATVDAAPPGSTVELAVRSGRVELRAPAPAERFARELARALAQRDRGDLHVFGTLAVLTVPAR